MILTRASAGLAWLFLTVALAGCSDGRDPPREPVVLSVMTFNAWGAGSNEQKSIDETIAVLRAANADVVGLQEVRAEADECVVDDCPASGAENIAKQLAVALGYYVYEQRGRHDALWANAILSRYPVRRSIDDDLGVVLDVDGRTVAFINIHLADYPYQPYQLLGIPYGDAPMLQTADEAIAAAQGARGHAVALVLDSIATLDDIDAVIVTGDFNEPSHRDWTRRAALSGRHPVAVDYPTVRAFERAGFIDAWRTV
ncbi:MAG: endonuclease/exonuclease/phosphatase family protein, partial [Woeseiaceae bacterium]|nr:endonuclease/exonuclease/phosphatase family protein [Woeseiaceae bacterium]